MNEKLKKEAETKATFPEEGYAVITLKEAYRLIDCATLLERARCAEIARKLKANERKVATFGDWQAESYQEKMLVNAVIEAIATTIEKEQPR